MEKMINYIFGSLESSNIAIGKIIKDLKRQGRINKWFTLLAVAGSVYIYKSETQRDKDREKIETLSKEVEELKKMKGE